ncbi:undecaprenyl-diphosphate phosphatase [bacterium]|nr:undecaprenyl-diphosphate phosphatase [bacterium]MBU1985287.1 undecaprenyl-diphosphate phosphatase [bacterium]
MSVFEAVLLGILQAVTEFLPVSSSGHLVLAQHLLGLREPMLAFDVLLHVGTLVAVMAFYRRELGTMIVSLVRPSRAPGGRHLILMMIAASIPTGLIGFGFQDFIESLFQSPAAVGFFWILTAGLLFGISRLTGSAKTIAQITVSDALLIGLFQGMAILPGVSRSGATIAMGVMCGLHPKEAAGFSFLISIPAILGATILQVGDIGAVTGSELGAYVAGAVAAAVVAYAAIWILLRLLQRRVIRPFAWYCLAAAVVALIVTMIGS